MSGFLYESPPNKVANTNVRGGQDILCIVTLSNVVMERVGCGEGVTRQGEILRCFRVCVRA